MTKQQRFEALQARWRKAKEKARNLAFDLRYHYGDFYFVSAPRAKREKKERASAAEEKASDAIFLWLDQNSPRSWRTGVPADWVCDSLTYADAITSDRLSVTPPVAYGCYPSDSVRFAQPVAPNETAPSW